MNISAKDLASLPMWPTFTTRQVNQLCRDQRIYAYKTSSEPFTPWIIPIESIAMYSFYHPTYREAILKMDLTGLGEHFMRIGNELKRCCSENLSKEETYTIEQLSWIFDAPINQVLTWFNERFLPFTFFQKKKEVPALKVSQFLENHRDRLKMLQERHDALLAKGDFMEDQVRHLLMLYTYYKSNGCLD